MTAMSGREALEVVRRWRGGDDVVITTMGTARDWMMGEVGPFDFVLVPSSMGQATSLGLGLAMAQPSRRVIVLNGDGSMLMNLGSLVTIAGQRPTNLVVVIFANGVYEITGGQPVPGEGGTDFVAMAKAVGLVACHRFETLPEWERRAPEVLCEEGPVVVVLEVRPDPEQSGVGPRSPGSAAARAEAFRAALLR